MGSVRFQIPEGACNRAVRIGGGSLPFSSRASSWKNQCTHGYIPLAHAVAFAYATSPRWPLSGDAGMRPSPKSADPLLGREDCVSNLVVFDDLGPTCSRSRSRDCHRDWTESLVAVNGHRSLAAITLAYDPIRFPGREFGGDSVERNACRGRWQGRRRYARGRSPNQAARMPAAVGIDPYFHGPLRSIRSCQDQLHLGSGVAEGSGE